MTDGRVASHLRIGGLKVGANAQKGVFLEVPEFDPFCQVIPSYHKNGVDFSVLFCSKRLKWVLDPC